MYGLTLSVCTEMTKGGGGESKTPFMADMYELIYMRFPIYGTLVYVLLLFG